MRKTLWTFLIIGYVLSLAMIFSPIIKPANAHLASCGSETVGCDIVRSALLFSQTITPVATAAAIGTTEQTFTVTGIKTTDNVQVSKDLAETSLCPLVGARISAADTLALKFSTLTAAACTPSAGTHRIVVFR